MTAAVVAVLMRAEVAIVSCNSFTAYTCVAAEAAEAAAVAEVLCSMIRADAAFPLMIAQLALETVILYTDFNM
jgi:hypothetical protein